MKPGKDWNETVDQFVIDRIKTDLGELDRELVEVEGNRLKPSQCYRIGINPLHVLFNTDCPDKVKEKVQAILFKYFPNESRTS